MAWLERSRSKLWMSLFPWLLALLFVLLALSVFGQGQLASGNVNDFVAYWAAARQALAGRNPYAVGPVLALEQRVGLAQSAPLLMRNPPWTIAVVAPFGLLPFPVAQRLWFTVCLAAVLVSAKWLWASYHAEAQPPWTAWLATGLFLPIAVVLAIGQISPLVLLGIAGFLHFEKGKRLGWAGAFLFLATLKPHLTFLVWVALLLWSIARRTVKTVAALASVTILASLAAAVLDGEVFGQYFDLLTNGGVLAELTPTISGLLRLSFGRYYPLQALPGLLALLWLFFHWRRSRVQWQWQQEMPILLLVSLLTVSYAWLFDQVALLPCVFQATAWATTSRRSARIGIATLYLGTNAAVLALILWQRTTFWYVWTAPAWLLLYIVTRVTGRTFWKSATE